MSGEATGGRAPRPLSWPDAARRRAWLRFLMIFYLWFFPAYFGAAALAQASGRAHELFMAWELAIPLLPWAIIPYVGVIPLYAAPAFQMQARDIARLSRQTTAATLLAFAVFVLAPTRVAYRPEALPEPWATAFAYGALPTPYNAAPSLHVAFAALILGACADSAGRAPRVFYAVAFMLVAASTVLTHQHHLVDVVAGLALAFLVRRLWPIGAAP